MRKYGGKAEDAFHVVIPSIPGYGFSGKPTTSGWGPARIAAAFVTLMKRLGYEKFFAQGGDWGALITDLMAVQSPENVLGMATNFPIGTPAELEKAAFGGAPAPANLSAEEKTILEKMNGSPNFKPQPEKSDKSFFDKVREMFS